MRSPEGGDLVRLPPASLGPAAMWIRCQESGSRRSERAGTGAGQEEGEYTSRDGWSQGGNLPDGLRKLQEAAQKKRRVLSTKQQGNVGKVPEGKRQNRSDLGQGCQRDRGEHA